MGYKEKFANTGKAKLNQKGERLNPGDYEVEITRCRHFTARNKKDEFFIATFKVLAAQSTGEINEKTGKEYEPTQVGVEREWMVKLDEDMTDTNLKGFMVAVLGIDASDTAAVEEVSDGIDDAFVEALDDPDDEACKNSLKGEKVHVLVKIITTKEKKQPFSLHVWSPSIQKAA